MTTPHADELVGEIVQGRYAVLEPTGADRYRVFDMKELRQLEMLRWEDQWLALGDRAAAKSPAAPAARRPAPPPLPPERPAPRRRVPTRRTRVASPGTERGAFLQRLEAAWFARGQLLEQGEAEAEVTDYLAYQEHLEELARRLEDKLPGASGKPVSNADQHALLLFALPELV